MTHLPRNRWTAQPPAPRVLHLGGLRLRRRLRALAQFHEVECGRLPATPRNALAAHRRPEAEAAGPAPGLDLMRPGRV